MKKVADNENEPTSFIALAAVTANVVRYLTSDQKNQKQTPKPDAKNAGEDANEKELADIHRRLREIARMEGRLRREN